MFVPMGIQGHGMDVGCLHIEQVLRCLPTFEGTVNRREYMTTPILTLLEELFLFGWFFVVVAVVFVCLLFLFSVCICFRFVFFMFVYFILVIYFFFRLVGFFVLFCLILFSLFLACLFCLFFICLFLFFVCFYVFVCLFVFYVLFSLLFFCLCVCFFMFAFFCFCFRFCFIFFCVCYFLCFVFVYSFLFSFLCVCSFDVWFYFIFVFVVLFWFCVFVNILFCFFVFVSDTGIKRPHYAYQLTLAFPMTLANDAFSAQTGYSDVSTLKNGQKSLQQPNISYRNGVSKAVILISLVLMLNFDNSPGLCALALCLFQNH